MKRINLKTVLILFLILVLCPAAVSAHTVVLDPGHQGSWVDMSDTEPLSPSSQKTKKKATTGTVGSYSGAAEYELNLEIAFLVRDELVRRGYECYLTREDHNTAISNAERARLAYDLGGDILIRIHANSSEESAQHGALAMTVTPDNPDVGTMYGSCRKLAEDVLDHYCESTGFENLGLLYTDEMAGMNWSRIPVMILEMGYMSNEADDLAMQEDSMQSRMAQGIADGVDAYFAPEEQTRAEGKESAEDEASSEEEHTKEDTAGERAEENNGAGDPEKENKGARVSAIVRDIYREYISSEENNGSIWAVSMEDLTGGEISGYRSSRTMQSASVIKVFIMGAVFDRILDPADEARRIPCSDNVLGQLDSLLHSMITVSDNDAANRLIEILGEGDFETGAAVVNSFCRENQYVSTSVGRRFLDPAPKGDNYTSAGDCRLFLSRIYQGMREGDRSCSRMVELLQGQTVKHKIPAGLPGGWSSGNKTGEMPEGYGFGCIENDIAIVFSPNGDYILTILSNELQGRNSYAQDLIRMMSSRIAQLWTEGEKENSAVA